MYEIGDSAGKAEFPFKEIFADTSPSASPMIYPVGVRFAKILCDVVLVVICLSPQKKVCLFCWWHYVRYYYSEEIHHPFNQGLH